jgi:hypothetical protein
MLTNFDTNIRKIHQAVAIFGPLNNAVRSPQRNFLHLPLHPTPDGLASGLYPGGGQARLDFKQGTLHYEHPQSGSFTFVLSDYTQLGLFQALLTQMRQDELAAFFTAAGDAEPVKFLIDTINADESKTVFLSLDEIAHDDEKLLFDTDVIGAYADVQYQVFTGLARFRARLEGHLSPIVVWPEHFDISTLWFKTPEMDEHQAHMNFGFTPYTPDQYDMPYLYSYAYPFPDDFEPFDLPEPAAWNLDGWTGIVVTYDKLMEHQHLADFVETIASAIYRRLYPMLADL